MPSSPPLLALRVKLVVSVSAFVMVIRIQFGRCFVCCSSTHCAPRAQPFVKLGARTSPSPPYGVGANDSDPPICFPEIFFSYVTGVVI